ncbi:MAG: FAD-binding oxidoreductase [Acetobacteraceae bacterium]
MTQAFAALLGPSGWLTGEDTAAYARDWTGDWQGVPLGVARPRDAEQAAALVRLCVQQDVALVPAGGRTGLTGAAVVGERPAIVVSTERMAAIRAVDAVEGTIVAEAGCTIAAVQRAAAEAGRLFPLSFGAEGSATVGGALSTNAGGIRALRYGSARDLCLGIEAVLPDGSLLDDLRRVRKNNTGYDLRHLLIGAEGTLGLITAAAFRLAPPLRALETALVAVPSPAAALALFARLNEGGADLVAFELIGALPWSAALARGLRAPLPEGSPWWCLLEAGSPDASRPLRPMLEALVAAALDAGEATDATFADSEAARAHLWKIRETIPEGTRALGPALPTDVAVPVSAVPEFLARAEAALARGWPEARFVAFGHLGDGNIHIVALGPRGEDQKAWKRRLAAAEEAINDLAVALGGSFSAEHGIGRSKLAAMRRLKPAPALAAMRAIKAALDPRGLFNPGKLLPDG